MNAGFPNRIWPLLGKELQLQQNAFGLCLILTFFQAGSLLLGLRLRPTDTMQPDTCFIFALWLQAVLLPITIGASATAEEQRIGVRAWHLTFPASSLSQWTVKLLVATGLTAVLGVGLVRAWSMAGAHFWPWSPELTGDFTIGDTPVPLMACAFLSMLLAFYASAVAKDTLSAFLTTTAVCAAIAIIISLTEPFYAGADVVSRIGGGGLPAGALADQLYHLYQYVHYYVPLPLSGWGYVIGIVVLALVILILLGSFRCYRTIDRALRSIWSSAITAFLPGLAAFWLVLFLFGAVEQWHLNEEAHPGIMSAK